MSAPTPDPAPETDAVPDAAATDAPESALETADTAQAEGARSDTSQTAAPKLSRRPLLLAGAGVLAVAAVWGGLALATTQHLFGDASVAGTKVGGMSPAAARSAVTEAVDAELAEPVTITVGDASDTLVPADSGVSANAADAVERLTSFTLNPVTIAHRLSGESVDAARVTTVDADALRSALVAKLGTLSTGTADASVTLDGATPVLHPGTVGTGLDVDASVEALAPDWPLGEDPVALVTGEAQPGITDADAQDLIDTTLTPLLSGDLTVTAAGSDAEEAADGRTLTLSPEQTAALTTITADGGDLTAALDAQLLHDAVIGAMGAAVETAAQDATWTIEGTDDARPTYVAARNGLSIDADALAADVLTVGTTDGDRTAVLPATVSEPEVTTPEKDWTMEEVVGEYSTPYISQYGRDQNLIAGTAAINATLVRAGETFSLSDALGPVDAEHGFAAAGVISAGQHTDAMGGGLSQVNTTVFNAGFEAGMDDVEHHPHTYWFTRYPAGRDATLWTGVLDLKFKNSTPNAVLLQAWVSGGEVHARLWGARYYDVSIDNGTPYNYRAYETKVDTGASCTPYGGGEQGFDITVTRHRTKPDGTSLPDDVLTTSYQSDNPVVCR